MRPSRRLALHAELLRRYDMKVMMVMMMEAMLRVALCLLRLPLRLGHVMVRLGTIVTVRSTSYAVHSERRCEQ
jgi:hypothetical protein